MATDTDATARSEEDNDLIRSMRTQIDELSAKLKSQESEIRGKVTREAQAVALMPDAYKGLATYFEQEVDGELTKEAAEAWLAEKVGTAPPETDTNTKDVADIADLGASTATPATDVVDPKVRKMQELEAQDDIDLMSFNTQLEQILNGS